jgi:hypothetical protein
MLDSEAGKMLKRLEFNDDERREIGAELTAVTHSSAKLRDDQRRALTLIRDRVSDRLSKLTDAYLDGAIDKDELHERKKALLAERHSVKDQMAELAKRGDLLDRALEIPRTGRRRVFSLQNCLE